MPVSTPENFKPSGISEASIHEAVKASPLLSEIWPAT
jgi:hypothetical protein